MEEQVVTEHLAGDDPSHAQPGVIDAGGEGLGGPEGEVMRRGIDVRIEECGPSTCAGHSYYKIAFGREQPSQALYHCDRVGKVLQDVKEGNQVVTLGRRLGDQLLNSGE